MFKLYKFSATFSDSPRHRRITGEVQSTSLRRATGMALERAIVAVGYQYGPHFCPDKLQLSVRLAKPKKDASSPGR